jgi:hypothetical protein
VKKIKCKEVVCDPGAVYRNVKVTMDEQKSQEPIHVNVTMDEQKPREPIYVKVTFAPLGKAKRNIKKGQFIYGKDIERQGY